MQMTEASVLHKEIKGGDYNARQKDSAKSVHYDGVSHHYGSVSSLNNVSLHINAGEIVSILGKSGCGKTSLLRVGAGIIKQSSGRFLINGKVYSDETRHTPAEKRNVGLVFQDFALFPHMTVLDNVIYGLRSLGRREARDIGLRALERVGLAHYEHAYPHMLSGGEQQRVAFTRAIVPRPGILFLDEPFSGLDQRLRETMRQETLGLLRDTQATCLLVTHDPEEAMLIGDRIVLMDKGTIVQDGSPKDLYYKPKNIFAAEFCSSLFKFETKTKNKIAHAPIGKIAAPGFGDGCKVVVAVRPQGFGIVDPSKGVRATITGKRFFGVAAMMDVQISGLESPLTIRARDHTREIGEDVGIVVNETEAFVFPA